MMTFDGYENKKNHFLNFNIFLFLKSKKLNGFVFIKIGFKQVNISQIPF